jgi:hypothetical protein
MMARTTTQITCLWNHQADVAMLRCSFRCTHASDPCGGGARSCYSHVVVNATTAKAVKTTHTDIMQPPTALACRSLQFSFYDMIGRILLVGYGYQVSRYTTLPVCTRGANDLFAADRTKALAMISTAAMFVNVRCAVGIRPLIPVGGAASGGSARALLGVPSDAACPEPNLCTHHSIAADGKPTSGVTSCIHPQP